MKTSLRPTGFHIPAFENPYLKELKKKKEIKRNKRKEKEKRKEQKQEKLQNKGGGKGEEGKGERGGKGKGGRGWRLIRACVFNVGSTKEIPKNCQQIIFGFFFCCYFSAYCNLS